MSAAANVFVCAIVLVSPSSASKQPETQLPEKRTAYPIPLPNLSVSFDQTSGEFEKVRISFGNEQNYASISLLNDYYVKVTNTGNQKQMYPEMPDYAYQISNFEAEQLARVCNTLIHTLRQFEENLKSERWDRCLYLDARFPRFLKGFYYLYCAARNSFSTMSRFACISDSLYESSLRSTKSEARIRLWRDTEGYAVKLRIATRELIFQTEELLKKELERPKRNREISYGTKFEEAYGLFIRMYFNLPTPPSSKNYW